MTHPVEAERGQEREGEHDAAELGQHPAPGDHRAVQQPVRACPRPPPRPAARPGPRRPPRWPARAGSSGRTRPGTRRRRARSVTLLSVGRPGLVLEGPGDHDVGRPQQEQRDVAEERQHAAGRARPARSRCAPGRRSRGAVSGRRSGRRREHVGHVAPRSADRGRPVGLQVVLRLGQLLLGQHHRACRRWSAACRRRPGRSCRRRSSCPASTGRAKPFSQMFWPSGENRNSCHSRAAAGCGASLLIACT